MIEPGFYKDLAGTIPCKDGDTVALWVTEGGNFSQPVEERRPIVHLWSGGFYIDGGEPARYLEGCP